MYGEDNQQAQSSAFAAPTNFVTEPQTPAPIPEPVMVTPPVAPTDNQFGAAPTEMSADPFAVPSPAFQAPTYQPPADPQPDTPDPTSVSPPADQPSTGDDNAPSDNPGDGVQNDSSTPAVQTDDSQNDGEVKADAAETKPEPGGPDDLLGLKKDALDKLAPLVETLDQSPAEKFKTTMMMIQASDNKALVRQAYEAAQAIEDDKERAQALLDIVNEINYFTQQS